MSAFAGIVLLSASIFGSLLGALLFRDPGRPGWARGDIVPDASALLLVACFAFGVAALANSILSLPQPESWWAGVAAVTGTIMVCWAAARFLRLRERLAAFDQEAELRRPASPPPGAAGRVHVVARGTPQTSEPPARPTGTGGRHRRKKAA